LYFVHTVKVVGVFVAFLFVRPSPNAANKGVYLALAREAANRHGIPADLFRTFDTAGSGWNTGALSLGAMGLAS
jgi:hypothetical protein